MNTLIVAPSLSNAVFDVLQTGEVKSEKNISLLPSNTMSNLEEPLYFPIVGGEASFFSWGIVRQSDGAVVLISQNVLGNLYFNFFREKTVPIFNKAVGNLLNIRNHLLLQLDLECGNISEEYFDKEEPKYLTEIEKIPLEKLEEEIRILFYFTRLPLDSEDISEILHCSVDDAEKALKNCMEDKRAGT